MEAERRIDSATGVEYTKMEFMCLYGGTAEWGRAKSRSQGLRTSIHPVYSERWDDEQEYGAVVHDNGSGMVKAGFSGEETPRTTFAAVVGQEDGKQARMP